MLTKVYTDTYKTKEQKEIREKLKEILSERPGKWCFGEFDGHIIVQKYENNFTNRPKRPIRETYGNIYLVDFKNKTINPIVF